jgi:hypothetical protein
VSYPNSLSGGFVKYAINGSMVFDQVPPSGDPLPPVPNRVKITPGYLNVQNTEIQADDAEVLATPPCGSFACGPPAHR